MGEPETTEEAILFPNADLDIGGETVTVREFGFMESMKLEPIAYPLIQALADIGADWASVSHREVMQVIADHDLAYAKLIAASVDRPLDWVQGLSDKEGMALSTAFWRVNNGFFVRRLLTLMLPQLARQAAKESAGAASLPH